MIMYELQLQRRLGETIAWLMNCLFNHKQGMKRIQNN